MSDWLDELDKRMQEKMDKQSAPVWAFLTVFIVGTSVWGWVIYMLVSD